MKIQDTSLTTSALPFGSAGVRDKIAAVGSVSSASQKDHFKDTLDLFQKAKNTSTGGTSLLSGASLTTLQDVGAATAKDAAQKQASDAAKKEATQTALESGTRVKEPLGPQLPPLGEVRQKTDAEKKADRAAALAAEEKHKELDPYTKKLLARLSYPSDSQATTPAVTTFGNKTMDDLFLPKSLSSSVAEYATERYATALAATAHGTTSGVRLAA